MDTKELRAAKAPPKDTRLTALWHAGKGEWDKAHAVIKDDVTKEGAWVRAHLHRAQGDNANAAQWYDKAGRPSSKRAVEEEWNEIAGVLLASHS